MKKIGVIFALSAVAVAGKHFEPGDAIKGVSDEEKAKLLRQRQATEDEDAVADVRAARKAAAKAAAVAAAAEDEARQAEIEETIRPAVEKIVGELLDERFPKSELKPESEAKG